MPVADEEVTQWMVRLGNGDQQAAQALWEEYFVKLVRYARRNLDGVPRRAADEEDVALSAMRSFCQAVAEHRFEQVKDREDLWKLLVTITARKACALRRRQFADKRGAGQVRGESAFLGAGRSDEPDHEKGIAAVLGKEPTPELAAMVAEECRQLLDRLGDETLRQVALWRLEGHSAREIAAKLGCVRMTVQRKLSLIRQRWFQSDDCLS
jgi:DNA-directed RNA polymerase specialized sigma24 family protein